MPILLLAAVLSGSNSYSFTAEANGLEKGAIVEFLFTGKDSDRDYETMFTLEKPIAELCRELEAKGLKRGRSTDPDKCVLWPEGVEIKIEPPLEDFFEITFPEGYKRAPLIYTGGKLNERGLPLAAEVQPFAFLSFYTLSQAPFQFNGSYPQGDVYNSFKVAKAMKKGEKVEFKLVWDPASTVNRIKVDFKPGELKTAIETIKKAAERGELSVLPVFSSDLTVAEATAAAEALRAIDSTAVKINGVANGDFFYQSFLPIIKWLDRKERLVQPFEISFSADGKIKIIYIDEDWSVPGDDPKLTEKEISIKDVEKYSKNNTAFIYAKKTDKLGKLQSVKRQFPNTIIYWYIYAE